jgi:hypothetical protein
VKIPRVFYNATYTVGNSTTPTPFGWTYGVPDNWGNSTITLPLHVGKFDENATFINCDGFENSPVDLSGYIVLIRRNSNCGDFYMASFAAKKGAKYVLWYSPSNEA